MNGNIVQNKIHQLSEMIHESQIMFAVIFGMFVQFFFGSSKTFKIGMSITVSGIFVAMYIVSPLLDIAGVADNSKIAIASYALSSLISMEILSVILTMMPLAFREKLSKILEIKNVTKK